MHFENDLKDINDNLYVCQPLVYKIVRDLQKTIWIFQKSDEIVEMFYENGIETLQNFDLFYNDGTFRLSDSFDFLSCHTTSLTITIAQNTT